MPPLASLRVLVRASDVAAAYAGRLLSAMGAEVILLEPPQGSPLRREPPFLPDSNDSALFAYLAAGARSMVAENEAETGALLSETDLFIDDTPLERREALGIDEAGVARRHPDLIHVSVLPFGAHGPKAGWKGTDLTLLHASGEGYLLPNGLTCELFPERGPVKTYGHFAALQGGIAAALGGLAALWARPEMGGQYVDVSGQDAVLAIGAFAIQRLGDGQVEHRVERSFRYGGVIPCADGHVELLTLEQRQWDGLVDLLGRPVWACDPALDDALERSRQGPMINRHIREWASTRRVEDIVREGQKRSVPLAKYYNPGEVLRDPHERARGLFQPVETGAGVFDMLVSPFQFGGEPLKLRGGPPKLGEYGRTAVEA
jgi:crotonobetainyl-CoA:carnitine CoA-transferase CaiB-like acyl-CoA transferase